MAPAKTKKLSVAVTGPTGEIGRSFIRALERSRDVGEIRGMARRPFDPESYGWKRAEYVRGDILDRDAVASFVAGGRRLRARLAQRPRAQGGSRGDLAGARPAAVHPIAGRVAARAAHTGW